MNGLGARLCVYDRGKQWNKEGRGFIAPHRHKARICTYLYASVQCLNSWNQLGSPLIQEVQDCEIRLVLMIQARTEYSMTNNPTCIMLSTLLTAPVPTNKGD